MTGRELTSDFSLLVFKAGDIDHRLSAEELCTILAQAETLILNQVHVAPCSHPGSRYHKEGEEYDRCGICSRSTEEK